MKAAGIVRRVDDLGRIVLPKNFRRTLGIKEGDHVEVFADNEFITLRKCDVGASLGAIIDKLENNAVDLYNGENRSEVLTKIAELRKAVDA